MPQTKTTATQRRMGQQEEEEAETCSLLYRVTQKVSDLGWVEIGMRCSTILLGQ